jgi:hypothetical protein
VEGPFPGTGDSIRVRPNPGAARAFFRVLASRTPL